MTIKQIAEVAGCSLKTVRRTIKDNFPDLTKNGKMTKLTKEQAFDIMAKLPKRNLVSGNLGQMSEVTRTNVQGLESRIDRLEAKFDKLLDLMIAKELANKPEPKLIAPKLEPKDEIRKIINSYTNHIGNQYRDNWNLLYQECYYRLGKNFRTLAQNRSVKPMDVIVEEGFAPDVLLVARDLFQLGTK